MRRSTAVAGALAAGMTILFTGPAASAAPTATDTLYVPDDFAPAFRAVLGTGHYEVEGTGLRVTTLTSADKVAEYVATNTPLDEAGDPTLDYVATSGAAPGYQLVIDLDGDGDRDGILVGEPTVPGYGENWWLASGTTEGKALAPHDSGGIFNTAWYGTLDEWRASAPQADVLAFGFSLGRGPVGDGVIESMSFAGTTYTFAQHVRVPSKQACKNGGWATSTDPVFRNQGECVSSFAKAAER
ncbi:hypothetical protein SAMN05660657_03506 [Geodermatophilus amargosae]|uniref:Uncharacterized protein n=1 Tax=Geodermatophilus amargosae TaxID=1296565 RepID=A0A1I7BD71_9ACTN|nr:hypothetical protein [Geodermatophilus amargosae]SFT85098.1 hypothetical protein SAMN05660657_03506 [Geodermatophilus amargosae]